MEDGGEGVVEVFGSEGLGQWDVPELRHEDGVTEVTDISDGIEVVSSSELGAVLFDEAVGDVLEGCLELVVGGCGTVEGVFADGLLLGVPWLVATQHPVVVGHVVDLWTP